LLFYDEIGKGKNAGEMTKSHTNSRRNFMLDNTCFKLDIDLRAIARNAPVWQFLRSAPQTAFYMILRLCNQHPLVLLASLIAVQFLTTPSLAQSSPSQFFDLVKRAVDSATTVRVVRLQKAILADDPNLTIGDIPAPLSERSFDKDDQRLRLILDTLSRNSSYDLEHMLATRTRAQYGIIFVGPSGSGALLFPLPIASQSTAVTTRFVTEHPIEVGSSTAIFADAVKLIQDIENILNGEVK